MRLIDCEQADLGALEERDSFGLGEPLGRDVDEAQLCAGNAVENLPVLGWVVRGVQARGRDSVAAQLRHLVAHERDQGRHDHSEVLAQQRGKLVAQRLAAAGRHHRQHIAAGQDCLDDLGLPGPERVEPERGAKHGLRRCEIGHSRKIPRRALFYICSWAVTRGEVRSATQNCGITSSAKMRKVFLLPLESTSKTYSTPPRSSWRNCAMICSGVPISAAFSAAKSASAKLDTFL